VRRATYVSRTWPDDDTYDVAEDVGFLLIVEGFGGTREGSGEAIFKSGERLRWSCTQMYLMLCVICEVVSMMCDISRFLSRHTDSCDDE
jgi:hypothetical protein